jgi:pyruvate dehydrogenase E2 component (dihydrolipoamide acetyltransferase)
MESGQIVKWLVKPGDQVKEGDTLAEVQTDKAVMNMEAFDDGVVAVLEAKEGEDIALGERVLVLAKKGEDVQAVAAQYASRAEAKPAATQDSGNGRTEREAREAPKAERAEAEAVTAAHSSPAARQPGERVRSTPLARKVAAEAGVSLESVVGTGPGGRVIRKDVDALLNEGRKGAARTSSPRAAAGSEPSKIPHSRMRRTIATRMQQAKREAPEIHVTVDIRMDQAMAVRERLNKQLEKEGLKLSVGDLITKAVAVALRRHPALNASWTDDAIIEHGEVNLGIAVAIEGGLIVPVLHGADRLGLREIRLGTQSLAEAARTNKLTARQMMGATFTISNLGMYGVRQFDAILNLPEVGILAVGATEPRPVVLDGQIVPGSVMTVTLTADHRAVDGATAAEFLRTLRGLLEEPADMLL